MKRVRVMISIEESGCTSSNDEINNESNKNTIISESFKGSQKHKIKLSRNSLEIVSQLDNPLLLLTLTCVSQFPIILDRLCDKR